MTFLTILCLTFDLFLKRFGWRGLIVSAFSDEYVYVLCIYLYMCLCMRLPDPISTIFNVPTTKFNDFVSKAPEKKNN